mmetsp:Transcript_45033/g.106975  ORF Transcript_45033/g.106975 Transcript_45033/m.106975 type:complete len:226 (-) Transcript_45033:110-787(-)
MAAILLFGAYFLFILVFAIGVCWLWPDFVDSATARGDFKKIRRALQASLLLQVAAELSVWSSGQLWSWMLFVIVFTNFWGMFDAFLRYPIVHDIDSLFGLKQVLLITARVCCYALGFKSIAHNAGWFVLLLLVCIFSLPILWLTALPIGDHSSYHMKHDVVDVDIAVRIWSCACSPTERKELRTRMRVWSRSATVRLAQAAPALKPVIVSWDPSLARVLSNRPSV